MKLFDVPGPKKRGKLMGKKRIQPKTITFKVAGPKINAECFTKSINNFFDLIDEVAYEVGGKKKIIDWIVSVKPGSIIISATPESANGSKREIQNTIFAVQRGIESLTSKKIRPKYFSERALKKLYDLSMLSSTHRDNIDEIGIRVNKKHTNITLECAANIDAIMGVSAKSYGTIEGKLEAIDIHKKLKISVYDDLTDKPVKCYFDEDMFDDIISAIGKRVCVYGLIKYRKSGVPVSVDIEELEIFPPKEMLPTADDVLGILNN